MSIVVRPVRFTDDVAAMQAFLELLGLQPRIEFNRPGWVDLAGSAGLVALHDAATSATGGVHGETRLSFEVDDADGDGEVAAGPGDRGHRHRRVLRPLPRARPTRWAHP